MHSVYPDSFTSRFEDAKSERQPQCESVVYAYTQSDLQKKRKRHFALLCCQCLVAIDHGAARVGSCQMFKRPHVKSYKKRV